MIRNMDSLRCPLCLGLSTWLFHTKKGGEDYYRCLDCDLIFLNPQWHLEPQQEHERYLTHENNVEDPGYQNYLKPVIDAVMHSELISAKGLDYGCGPSSVVSYLLRQKGYDISEYDPFFANDPKQLEIKYDYLVCTEVVEHFYQPFVEFGQLKSLIKTLGSLYIKTSLTDQVKNFETWHYHRDPTHVCFYSSASFQWICKNLRWSALRISSDCIMLKRV